MNKNKQYRAKRTAIRNAKRAMNSKKRSYPRVLQDTPSGAKFVRAYKPCEEVKVFEHGPSQSIKLNSDGKPILMNGKPQFIKRVEKGVRQKDYTTSMAKQAMQEIRNVKQFKKELIRETLSKIGYDNTISYTRKEKKRFTRAVKKAWIKALTPKQTKLTTKEVKARIGTHAERKQKKIEKYNKLPYYKDALVSLPNVKGKQRPVSVTELINIRDNEKPNKRKFTYAISRVKEEDLKLREEGRPYRTYDFLTDYFEEETIKKAEKKIGQIAKKYLNDTSFTGITLKDPDGENLTKYYTLDNLKLLAA